MHLVKGVHVNLSGKPNRILNLLSARPVTEQHAFSNCDGVATPDTIQMIVIHAKYELMIVQMGRHKGSGTVRGDLRITPLVHNILNCLIGSVSINGKRTCRTDAYLGTQHFAGEKFLTRWTTADVCSANEKDV